MPTPILRTKLHIPYFDVHELVVRPRLAEKMSLGLARKLTLIAAPAGSGKSAVVCQWLQESDQSVAWLSLDRNDNHLVQFLRYMLAAIQQNHLHIGKALSQILQEAETVDHELILSELVNEIDTKLAPDDKLILVLDDYHFITEDTIHEAVRYLLDYLPPAMHLIMTTRVDPPFPLGRMRVKRHLNEIRGADLRFSQDELHDYFAQVMQLELKADTLQQLEERTEGWIAGAQLAGLSLQGQNPEEAEQLLADLTGSDRYIADYLIDEVLQRQPADVRNFLLQTSILEKLTSSLCDAVTEQRNSHQRLRELDANNFFLIPLDNEREWYRYHHLFQELLQAQLQFQQAVDAESLTLAHLHQRASEWYHQYGAPADAIRHALAANDFARAADLVELRWRAMDRSFQEATWLGWVQALPEDVIQPRPVLSTGYAWALLDTGNLEAAEPHLQNAEQWLDMAATANASLENPPAKTDLAQIDLAQIDLTGMVIADAKESQSLPATIAAARAYLAQALGDLSAAETYARRALDLLPEDDHFYRGIPSVIIGLAYWARGALEMASRSFIEATDCFQMANNGLFTISSLSVLAAIKMAQGELHEAFRTYQRALQVVASQAIASQGKPMIQATANLYRGLSKVHREWGDLQTARGNLQKSEQLSKQASLTDRPHRLCIAMARMKKTEGDFDGALDLLAEAAQRYTPDRLPDIRPIVAMKAEVWTTQGRLAEAQAWARQQNLSYDDDLIYLHEFEYMILARLLIAQYKHAPDKDTICQALDLLERLLDLAEGEGRIGSVIEILVLQAVAHEVQSNITTALVSLQRAITLAEPEGYIQLFVDEDPPMTTLLHQMTQDGMAPAYIRQVQDTLAKGAKGVPVQQNLVEPLSERELEVLRLAAAGRKNKEIADELFISLNTVLYHTKNAYGKLGVNKRTLALAKARELGLL